jgi:hypothetical protein
VKIKLREISFSKDEIYQTKKIKTVSFKLNEKSEQKVSVRVTPNTRWSRYCEGVSPKQFLIGFGVNSFEIALLTAFARNDGWYASFLSMTNPNSNIYYLATLVNSSLLTCLYWGLVAPKVLSCVLAGKRTHAQRINALI